jgi:hypothetical protein
VCHRDTRFRLVCHRLRFIGVISEVRLSLLPAFFHRNSLLSRSGLSGTRMDEGGIGGKPVVVSRSRGGLLLLLNDKARGRVVAVLRCSSLTSPWANSKPTCQCLLPDTGKRRAAERDRAQTTGQSVCRHPALPQLTPMHYSMECPRGAGGRRPPRAARTGSAPPPGRHPGACALVPSLSRRHPHLRAHPTQVQPLAVHAQPTGGQRVREGVPQVLGPPAPPARARAHRHLGALRQVLEEGCALSQPLDQVRRRCVYSWRRG